MKKAPLSLFECVTALSCVIVYLVGPCIVGCAHLSPTADPLVVRAEQVGTTGDAAFKLALKLDNSNRPFWMTNASDFHAFCEWLRSPVIVEATNKVTRAQGLVIALDDIKRDYKAGRASSNAVITAIFTLQSTAIQAQDWLSVATNTVPKL